jgi:hypothetical protein
MRAGRGHVVFELLAGKPLSALTVLGLGEDRCRIER